MATIILSFGAAAAGGAGARARVAVLGDLTLADFDTAGLELDVLALIQAGAGANDTIFSMAPRDTVGALLAGELGLGPDDVPITRLRRRDDNTLAVNDSAAFSLAAYFGAGGAGAGLRVYLQTRDGLASMPASEHARLTVGLLQLGPLTAEFAALLYGIAEGDRFIFALASDVLEARGRAAAGPPQAALRPELVPIRAIRGAAIASEPAALRLRLALIRAIRAIRGAAAAGPPAALARASVNNAAALFARWQRENAPADRVVTALEIRHPAVPRPVRVVNDSENRRIEGNEYIALRFDARLADDIAGQAPQAELAIDNIGRELTQWIEAAGGGLGATVRVMLVLAVPNPSVDWELTLDVAGVNVDQERVTARLGFDPLLGAAAVRLRHDPETSPGLF